MILEQLLIGAHVQRIAQLAPNLIALELHARDLHGALLLGIGGEARGIGWIDGKTRGGAARRALGALKSHLVGARVTAAVIAFAHVRLGVTREGKARVFDVTFRSTHAELTLSDSEGTSLVSMRGDSSNTADSSSNTISQAITLTVLREHSAILLGAGTHDALVHAREHRLDALRTKARRSARTLKAIEGDLARGAEIPVLRKHAGLILSHLHALAPAASEAILLDLSTDPPTEVTLRFDPQLGPKQQAEAWFRRARRLDRGMAIATQRADATREELTALAALEVSLRAADSLAALEALDLQADRLGVRSVPQGIAPTSSKERDERLPYREFRSQARVIMVGRGAADNDRLTSQHSKPHDLWLHVRDRAGAHVVVPLTRNEACPPELLVDAATLAAHFSGERGESLVDVLYTARRFVRKPRGSAPGSVVPMQEKVLRLRLEPERLKRLLASERR